MSIERILLVEDDENDLLLFRRILNKVRPKHLLFTATNGDEAIRFLKDRTPENLPSMVLTDLKMPKKTGFDLLAWRGANPSFAALPIFVLTTSTQVSDVKKAYEAGANLYFVKPSDPAAYETMLQRMFEVLEVAHLPAHAGSLDTASV